jgi:hypothetical protein
MHSLFKRFSRCLNLARLGQAIAPAVPTLWLRFRLECHLNEGRDAKRKSELKDEHWLQNLVGKSWKFTFSALPLAPQFFK